MSPNPLNLGRRRGLDLSCSMSWARAQTIRDFTDNQDPAAVAAICCLPAQVWSPKTAVTSAARSKRDSGQTEAS